MRLLGSTVTGKVNERTFVVVRDGGEIPGVVWVPEGAAGPRPLVLLGHGGSGHKREEYILSFARRLVRHLGVAVAAIDGPVHGDRVPPASTGGGAGTMIFAQLWSSRPEMTDEMVADWRATLVELRGLEEIGDSPVGYWGLSMGTILGLPFVAAEPAISVAVLGLMGLTGPTRARIEHDAPLVTCPVLMLAQWDDELFERGRALDLFDLIGSKDKRLHVNPGGHVAVPSEEFDFSEQFLGRHLLDKGTKA